MESGKILHNEVRVKVRFVGDKVDPKWLTSKLGLQPSKAHAKGEVSQKRSKHIYTTGYWGIDSPYASDQPLEKHLEYLLDILEPKIPILKQLGEAGLFPNFYCGFFTADEELSTFIKLETITLERLVRIGASLDCHIYCCD